MAVTLQPFFLPSSPGNLFCIYFAPGKEVDIGRDVLLFPPFAEELNKSRRMLALQANALAERGYGVLIPDLYGTADSEGDFIEGRWDLWLDNMASALEWLRAQGRPQPVYWGMRLGALLAMDAVLRWEVAPPKIIFWQAVGRGDIYLTQFLRLRLAADMMTNGEVLTTDDMRRDLAQGRPVEVAGYMLHPELAASIDRLNLSEMVPPVEVPVEWLEVIAAPGRPIAHANRKIIDYWTQQGVEVSVASVVGENFWTTPEISQLPSLVDMTVQRLKT